MVLRVTRRRAGAASPRGEARTREVKLCCCFTQTSLDEDGHPVRDPHSSSYLATFAPAAQFGILMAGEARRRGAGHVRQLVILGDGAAWIWNLACPPTTTSAKLVSRRHHALPSWPARAIASVVSLAAPIQSSSPMKRDAGYSRIAGW